MLAVLCLSVVRDLHEVFGDLLPSPFPLLIRTVIHTLTESADMVRAENTFQDAEHFSCLEQKVYALSPLASRRLCCVAYRL